MTQVTNHWTAFCLPFHFPVMGDPAIPRRLRQRLRDLTLADLAAALPLPAPARRLRDPDQGASRHAATRVWEEAEALPVAEDLHEHVGNVLNGQSPRSSDSLQGFFGLPPLTLSADAKNLLSGAVGQTGLGFAVDLGPAGRKLAAEAGSDAPAGLQQNGWWPVRVEDAWVLMLGTGIGALILRLGFRKPGKRSRQPTIAQIQETLHRLSRLQNPPPLAWLVPKDRLPVNRPPGNTQNGGGEQDGTQENGAGQERHIGDSIAGLGALAAALVPFLMPGEDAASTGPDGVAPAGSRRHVFSFSLVNLDAALPEEGQRRALAIRLARRYTDAYLIPDHLKTDGVLRPFQGITHAFGLEGGAMLVESRDADSREIGFLKSSIAGGPARWAYLPISLIAFLEYLALTRMSEEAAHAIDFHAPHRAHIKHLEDRLQEVLNYRLNYRFSHVSQISMHDEVYRVWRRVLATDEILADVSRDVDEIHAYLARLQAEAVAKAEKDRLDAAAVREARYNRLARRISAVGLAFASVIGAIDLTGVNLLAFVTDDPQPPGFLLAVLGAALVIGLVLAAWLWLSDPQKDRKD